MLAHRHYSEQTVDMERVLFFVLVGYFVFCFLFYFYFYSFFLFFFLAFFFSVFCVILQICFFYGIMGLLLLVYGAAEGQKSHHWTNMPDTGHILYNKTNIAKLLKLFIYLLVVFFSFVCRHY